MQIELVRTKYDFHTYHVSIYNPDLIFEIQKYALMVDIQNLYNYILYQRATKYALLR